MKTMKMMVMGLGLGFAGLVQAAGFGVIDLGKVVESSTYLKQQNASLEQSVKPQTTKLEQISKDIEALKQKAQAQGANVQQINAQYQAKVNEFQTIQQGVQTKVQSAIQSTNKTSTLAFDPKSDLTAKMIQKVNAIK